MAIKIMSFNVKNLSDGQGRDIERIAHIINQNRAEIVCLQEVLQEGKILSGLSIKDPIGQEKAYARSLRSKLCGDWDSEWQQPKLRKNMEAYLGGDKRGEGYAILWRKDGPNKLRLMKDENNKEIRPQIWGNYDTRVVGSKLRLIRDPMYARFKVKGRRAELRVITTHIVYGKSDAVKDVVDYGAIMMRKKEFDLLAGQIYYRISRWHKQKFCTSPYTILMGDYNLNLESQLKCFICYDDKGHVVQERKNILEIHNLQKEKTTLSKNEAVLANSYDHFTVDQRTNKQIVTGSVQVVDAIHKYNKDNGSEEELYNTYRTKVSDHLPIVMSINI